MIKNLKINGNWNALQNQYICDTADELEEIENAPFGSLCYVIATGVTYIKGSNDWAEYQG